MFKIQQQDFDFLFEILTSSKPPWMGEGRKKDESI
jgi:hypothetical protein